MNELVDIPGQQESFTDLYTQICFCYGVDNDSLYPSIVNTLTEGLERLTATFPWVAGKVENMKIKPFESIPKITVRDLRDDPTVPTMMQMRSAQFPMRMFDEDIFAACKTLASNTLENSPVFLVQVNFIVDGVVITFNGNHQAMDMIGQGEVIRLLSKACNHESFTQQEIQVGNSRNEKLINLLEDAEYEKHINSKPKEKTAEVEARVEAETVDEKYTCRWFDLVFNNESLQKLKNTASKDITTEYISTDDALSAYLWKAISKARQYRLKPTTTSTFARAVDVRKYLDIPSTYPGMIQIMTYHDHSIKSLEESSVGRLSSQLRYAVDNKTSTLGFDARLFATSLKKAEDKSSVSLVSGLDLTKCLTLSSWAKIDGYNLDFNLGLGAPEAVRRPLFIPCESLIYILPRKPDGEIVVVACLREEDINNLQKDEEFNSYAQFL